MYSRINSRPRLLNANQGYILHKFSNKTSAGVKGVNSTFVDTDFPLFRLADAYLMYAEAQMKRWCYKL
jgi:hypothetical protein